MTDDMPVLLRVIDGDAPPDYEARTTGEGYRAISREEFRTIRHNGTWYAVVDPPPKFKRGDPVEGSSGGVAGKVPWVGWYVEANRLITTNLTVVKCDPGTLRPYDGDLTYTPPPGIVSDKPALVTDSFVVNLGSLWYEWVDDRWIVHGGATPPLSALAALTDETLDFIYTANKRQQENLR